MASGIWCVWLSGCGPAYGLSSVVTIQMHVHLCLEGKLWSQHFEGHQTTDKKVDM